jgi:endonuclease/exonuclease/phosphatase (EEP) superfamily protein YafD
LARLTGWGIWLYTVALVVVWLALRLGGDRWWPATLLLFGPRWLCGVPLIALAPLAAWSRRRLVWVLAADLLIVVAAIMGLCLPVGQRAASKEPTLRILTCNVKGRCTDNAALDRLIQGLDPDLVALQGCWGDVRIAWPQDWHVWQRGAIVVASRYPIRDCEAILGENPPHRWPSVNLVHCLVETPRGEVPFVSVHLPSPHDGIEQILDRKTLIRPTRREALLQQTAVRWEAAEEVSQWARGLSDAAILAGDFNTPPDSCIYREHWRDFGNAFSQSGLGFGYTEWPRIKTRWFGLRIDHILYGSRWQARRCWVGPDIGSDHLPLIADLSAK